MLYKDYVSSILIIIWNIKALYVERSISFILKNVYY